MKSRKIAEILLLTMSVIIIFSATANATESRLIPVAYKSCDQPGNIQYSATHLWDGVADTNHKWCCFHAGYRQPQIHWVAMDFGAVYPVTRIVVIHDGTKPDRTHLNTEDFNFVGSTKSIEGPWFSIKEIKDNTKAMTEFTLAGVNLRYLKLEVTDPQVSAAPNSPRDDWAVRIRELYVFTSDTKGASDSKLKPIAGYAPTPYATTSVGSSPVQVTPVSTLPASHKGQILYYFYEPTVANCKKQERIFSQPQVRDALGRYKTEAILTSSQDPRIEVLPISWTIPRAFSKSLL